jgi:hypothetical protein
MWFLWFGCSSEREQAADGFGYFLITDRDVAGAMTGETLPCHVVVAPALPVTQIHGLVIV